MLVKELTVPSNKLNVMRLGDMMLYPIRIEANILFKITYYMTPLPKFGMI